MEQRHSAERNTMRPLNLNDAVALLLSAQGAILVPSMVADAYPNKIMKSSKVMKFSQILEPSFAP